MIDFDWHNLHNYTFEQVQKMIGSRIETARMLQAAIKIQRSWRFHRQRKTNYQEWRRQDQAARMIQRNYKASVWVRMMNKLVKRRKEAMAIRIQKYLRSFLTNKKLMLHKKEKHLNENFNYFEEIRKTYLIDA